MIELIVECDKPVMKWGEFVSEKKPFSISLDGHVHGGPQFFVAKDPSKEGPYANFNHHEEVDRLATRATCAQILMVIRSGLFSTYRDVNGPRANIFVNDCDEDVCTSWFLLKNHFLVESTMNPLVNRLVDLEDNLDATAGAYPYPKDLPVLQELAWVFEIYRNFRMSGGLDRKNNAEYKAVIQDTERRIMAHITGHGGTMPLDVRYEKMAEGGPGWTMVREIGAYAKTGMFSDKIEAFVTVRNRADGNYTYTLGRLSHFVEFDVENIINHLNAVEYEERKAAKLVLPNGPYADKWGGGNTIGGSPRVAGSRLTPARVAEIINKARG